jgi:hypothetical protein
MFIYNHIIIYIQQISPQVVPNILEQNATHRKGRLRSPGLGPLWRLGQGPFRPFQDGAAQQAPAAALGECTALAGVRARWDTRGSMGRAQNGWVIIDNHGKSCQNDLKWMIFEGAPISGNLRGWNIRILWWGQNKIIPLWGWNWELLQASILSSYWWWARV